MRGLADDLLQAARDRLRDLDSLLESLGGRLAATAEATRLALNVFSTYRALMHRQIERDWDHFPDPDDRVELLRFYLRDIGARLEELEEWFAGGWETAVPPALVDAVTAECRESMGVHRHAVLAIGEPDNLSTLVDELAAVVFQAITPETIKDSGLELPDDKFALIQVSRFEANNPIWRPLILGHEVAHLVLLEKSTLDDFTIVGRLDPSRVENLATLPEYENLESFKRLAVETAAEDWLEELLCDAYVLRRFGPAAVGALGAYFEQVGQGGGYGTHPPGWLRIRLMLHWLGDVDDLELSVVTEPWAAYAAEDHDVEDDWAAYLIEVFEKIADEIPGLLNDWPRAYDTQTRGQSAAVLAGALVDGIPLAELKAGAEVEPALDADIINAGWLARSGDPQQSLYPLVEKALEAADFMRRWLRADGPALEASDAVERQSEETPAGLLTEDELRYRCDAEGPERLVVTPLLPKAIKESSIDVRLGRFFIVFQRASTGAFDALVEDNDPRAMQRMIERRWGEPFVLHPGELVLAATFEYLVLPSDVGAQVITRSSYGRLGLITATAIQVHPLFRGCLTLELINLGALPISLYPGERVAQLAFSAAAPPLAEQADQKYDCPTKPEFSRVRKDWDAAVLRGVGD